MSVDIYECPHLISHHPRHADGWTETTILECDNCKTRINIHSQDWPRKNSKEYFQTKSSNLENEKMETVRQLKELKELAEGNVVLVKDLALENTSLRAQVERLESGLDLIYNASGQFDNPSPESVIRGIQNMRLQIDGRNITITDLKHRLEECEKALKPLAEHRYVEDELIKNDVVVFLTVGDCRAARKALEGKG